MTARDLTRRCRVGSYGRRAVCLVLLAGAVALGACRRSIEPVDPETGEMCALCKMAITERRYVAEFVDTEGEAVAFDDIKCMLDYLGALGDGRGVAATFVTDFELKRWLVAEEAFYVRSPEIRTPMGGGIAAFGDEARARDAAARFHGALIRFGELR